MAWALLILGNFGLTLWLCLKFIDLRSRVAELENLDMTMGFRPVSSNVWNGSCPVSEDVSDMSEGVVYDDLT